MDITRLRDGTLVLRILQVDHGAEQRLMYNAETQGLLPMETCYVTSTDNGSTWTDPVAPDTARFFEPHHVPASIGPVIERPDGTWFQVYETWKTYNEQGPFDLNTYGMISCDKGRTWSKRVPIAVGSDRGISYSHGVPTVLDDGRVMISLWTADSDLQNQSDLHLVVSEDADLESWGKPYPTGIHGQSSSVTQLNRETIVLLFSHREGTDNPGIKLAISTDMGRTFDTDAPLIVWDAYGKESLGVPRTATYPSSHDSIAYGAPRVYRQDQEHAVGCYWCTQGADTHARWFRAKI